MNTRGIIGLALFLVGTSAAFTLSARDTLADVPWQYMPAETAAASVAAFNATFIPVAQGYMTVLDGVGDIQADAYKTNWAGLAAVGAWYNASSAHVDARLAP